MPKKSMSDIIEEYLKSILDENESIIIQRNEIANSFNCVPSQINYVINTRFTIKQGYIVESKRGGGGYIRIQELNLVDDRQKLNKIIEIIGHSISEREARGLIKLLLNQKIVSKDQAVLMSAGMDNTNFEDVDNKIKDKIRAKLLKKLIISSKYD